MATEAHHFSLIMLQDTFFSVNFTPFVKSRMIDWLICEKSILKKWIKESIKPYSNYSENLSMEEKQNKKKKPQQNTAECLLITGWVAINAQSSQVFQALLNDLKPKLL